MIDKLLFSCSAGHLGDTAEGNKKKDTRMISISQKLAEGCVYVSILIEIGKGGAKE